MAHEELQTTHARSEEGSGSLKAELERVQALNEKLENDLMSLNKGGDGDKTERGAGLAGLDIGRPERGASPAPSGDTSILPIVTSQRDRFRQRNAELEDELRRQFETISDLRAEIKTLQADNLKLYEKVRYMQSYRDTSSAVMAGNTHASSSTSQAGMLNGALRSRDDDIGRYKDKYDESLNPFEAFKGREAQRAIQALNPLERAVFALTRAIIGNKRSRSLFILYAASLVSLQWCGTWTCADYPQHFLVLFVIWNGLGSSTASTPITIQPHP